MVHAPIPNATEARGLQLLQRVALVIDTAFTPDTSLSWEPNGGERTDKKGRARTLIRHRLGTSAMAFIREHEVRTYANRTPPETFETLTLRTLKLAGGTATLSWQTGQPTEAYPATLLLTLSTGKLSRFVLTPLPVLDEIHPAVGEDHLLQLLIAFTLKLYPQRAASALQPEPPMPAIPSGYDRVNFYTLHFNKGMQLGIWLFERITPASYGRPGDYMNARYRFAIAHLPAGYTLAINCTRDGSIADEVTLEICCAQDAFERLLDADKQDSH